MDNSTIVTRQFGTSTADYVLDAKFGKHTNGLFGGYTTTFLIAGATYGAFSGYSNAGSVDAYWAKCTESQSYIWPYNITYTNTPYQFGSSGADYVSSLYFDGSTYLYTGGYTSGALEGSNAGSYDNFIRKASYSSGSQSCINQWGTATSDYLKAMAPANGTTKLIYIANEGSNMSAGHIYFSDCSIDTPNTIDPNGTANARDIWSQPGSSYYWITGEYFGGSFFSLPSSDDRDVFKMMLNGKYEVLYTEEGIEDQWGQNAVSDYGVKILHNGNTMFSIVDSYDDVGTDSNAGGLDGFVFPWW